jgi:hypothetical protein
LPRSQYEQSFDVPRDLSYGPNAKTNGPASLPLYDAGIGVIRCSTFFGYNHGAWGDAGSTRPLGLGARGEGEESYRGEAYFESGDGVADVLSVSYNAMVVQVRGGAAGDWLRLNQNWDESWRANGVATVDRQSVNGYALTERNERVVFHYVPRTFPLGCAVAAGTLGALVVVSRRRRWGSSPDPAKHGGSLSTKPNRAVSALPVDADLRG